MRRTQPAGLVAGQLGIERALVLGQLQDTVVEAGNGDAAVDVVQSRGQSRSQPFGTAANVGRVLGVDRYGRDAQPLRKLVRESSTPILDADPNAVVRSGRERPWRCSCPEA